MAEGFGEFSSKTYRFQKNGFEKQIFRKKKATKKELVPKDTPLNNARYIKGTGFFHLLQIIPQIYIEEGK